MTSLVQVAYLSVSVSWYSCVALFLAPVSRCCVGFPLCIKAGLNYFSQLTIFQAVCRNNVETIEFLLDHGVDVTVKDIFDNTAVDNAKKQGLIKIVKLFDDYIGMRVNRPSA